MMIMGLKRGEMLFISWMFTVFPFLFSTFTFEEKRERRWKRAGYFSVLLFLLLSMKK